MGNQAKRDSGLNCNRFAPRLVMRKTPAGFSRCLPPASLPTASSSWQCINNHIWRTTPPFFFKQTCIASLHVLWPNPPPLPTLTRHHRQSLLSEASPLHLYPCTSAADVWCSTAPDLPLPLGQR